MNLNSTSKKSNLKIYIYILYLREKYRELRSSCNYRRYCKKTRGIKYYGYKYTEDIKDSGEY
jgi:hypothetical protein